MEYLAKYITKQNIVRAAVFSVLTTGAACLLYVVLAKYLNGGVFSVTRIVIGTAAAAAFCFLASLTLITAARMDLIQEKIQEKSEKAKKIRDAIILLCWLCLGLLVYLDWLSFYCLLPLVLLFTTKNSNFKVALLILACLFFTGFPILIH